MEITEHQPAGRDRRPALALFAGGGLSGAAVVVLALTLAGVVRPGGSPSSSSASPTPDAVVGPLVTLSPIVGPSVVTPTDLAVGHALGALDAPVTIEIWADFQCPYCALFASLVEPRIVDTYVKSGRARLVFRDLAFLGEESRWAAVAARLAEEQGAFWPFHDYLFANQQGENRGSFAIERLREIAGRVGLDRATFDAGLKLETARALFAVIRAEFETDAARLGIRSTPTVTVNGTVVDGNDWETVRAAIDGALTGD
jgi:protein-disulfide isomerase